MLNKKRQLIPAIVLGLLVSACSKGGDGGAKAAAETPAPPPWGSYVVSSSADLPGCSGEVVGRLYYIKAEAALKACDSSGWITVNTGTYMTSNKIIDAYGPDICSSHTNLGCYFNGGQIVKYSDGSILMLGSMTTIYYTTSGDVDTDSDTSSISVVLPANVTLSYQTLSELVDRGSGFRRLFLMYSRSSDTIALVVDTNNDQTPDSNDEIVGTLSVSDWGT